jgi:hypothetical protein
MRHKSQKERRKNKERQRNKNNEKLVQNTER